MQIQQKEEDSSYTEPLNMRDTSSVALELDAPIPREHVSERQQAGRSLSYLEGWYVIDRLNKVLGQGNWQYEAEELRKTHETTLDRNGKSGRAVSYLATVRLTAVIGSRTVCFVDVGAGKGIDYNNGLEADESATKEAVTDGLKRCAKNLGMGLGLALYDKTQANVSDEEPAPAATPAAPVSAPKAASTKFDAKAVRNLIRASVKALEAKGKLTIESFKADYLKEYNAGNLDVLSDAQVQAVISKLQTNHPEVK